jgi:hypothetical protein
MNPNSQQHDSTDDLLTESLLCELIGGESPPDLKGRILSRLAQSQGEAAWSYELHDCQPLTTTGAPRSALSFRARRRHRNWTNSLVAVACLVVLISLFGVLAWKSQPPDQKQIVRQSSPAAPTAAVVERNKIPTTAIASNPPEPVRDTADASADETVAANQNDRSDSAPPPGASESLAKTDVPLFERMDTAGPLSGDDEIVAFLDRQIRQQWRRAGIDFAAPVKNKEWLDRLYVSLLGRQPLERERNELAHQRPRTNELIRQITTDSSHRHDFDVRWSELLTELIFHRPEIRDRSGDITALFQRHLEQDRPFDQTIRELVAQSDFDVVRVTRAFSGERLICASCHESRQGTGDIDARYQQLASAYSSNQESKESFVLQLSASDAMRQTIVNRLWWYFFDYGLIARDFESGTQQVVHPEIMERLSREFLASNHSVRKLVLWIASTEFAFSEYPRMTPVDSPDRDWLSQFNQPYRRQYLTDSIRRSLSLVADTRDMDLVGDGARLGPIANISSSSQGENDGQKIPDEVWQTIARINRDADGSQRYLGQSKILRRIAESELKTDEKVAHIFFAAVGRRPAPDELKLADRILKAQSAKPFDGLRDICWSILMSQEGMRP